MLPSILSQPWLFGATLSIASSCLVIVGFFLQKVALKRIAKRTARQTNDGNGAEPPARVRWCDLLRSGIWWCGLVLMIGHYPLVLYTLTFTPETTVLPLGACKVALNFVIAYGLLNERFTRSDKWASVACILGVVAIFSSMPHSVPGYMENFPLGQLSAFCGSLFTNVGFALYTLIWLLLLALCLYTLWSATLSGALEPCVLPLLVGLFSSQFHFTSKLLTTLALGEAQKSVAWQISFSPVATASVLLAVAMVTATCEGLRQLDCRFFVPAAFAATTGMVAVEYVVLFRTWQLMSELDLLFFALGCIVSILGAVHVSPGHTQAISKKCDCNAPLLALEESAPLKQYQGLLQIMEEHKMIRAPQPSSQPLEVIDLISPQKGFWACLRCLWKWVPISSCLGVVVLCAGLWVHNCKFLVFSIITAWAVHNGWKYGLHMALFSYVGQKKMVEYEKGDFKAIHVLQMAQQAAEPEGPRWEDVVHFVLLPNYKEDIEVLRLAISSVAASPIAASQIGVVLAMEMREKGAEAKAKELQEEFAGQFRCILVTYHPPNIPGETPGKSSNVKWAATKVIEDEAPKAGLDLNRVVITVADADSEFHLRYFEALTYQFVHADCGESETPDRYLSIWQPPILHYKNYHTQPVIVRLASLISSQHELANLADPYATRVPYSTYSISATLAKAVSGWDPDWISEDWHMGIKCFLATAGRIRIQPIFLGIMNYAPEGSNYFETICARWTQAKRHALGFSEIVFFLDHFPRVLFSIKGGQKRALFIWRSFFLWSRCMLIHLTMATILLLGPIAALIIAYFLKHQILEDVNSWTFLTYCVFTSTGTISTVLFMFTNVLLVEFQQSRIDSCLEPWQSALTGNRWLHFLWVTLSSMALMPIFFLLAGMAEWIAAIKTARTHKFQYEVAMKPNLSGSTLASGEVVAAAVTANGDLKKVANSGV